MNNKLSLSILLSLSFFMQSSDKDGLYEVPSAMGRTFVAEPNSEWATMLGSLDDAEFNCHLREARARADQEGAAKVAADLQASITNLNRAAQQNPSNVWWYRKQIRKAQRIYAEISNNPSASISASAATPAAVSASASASAASAGTSTTQAFSGFSRDAMKKAFGGGKSTKK